LHSAAARILGYRAQRLNKWVIVAAVDLAQADAQTSRTWCSQLMFLATSVSAMLAIAGVCDAADASQQTLGLQQVAADVQEFRHGRLHAASALWAHLVPSAHRR